MLIPLSEPTKHKLFYHQLMSHDAASIQQLTEAHVIVLKVANPNAGINKYRRHALSTIDFLDLLGLSELCQPLLRFQIDKRK